MRADMAKLSALGIALGSLISEGNAPYVAYGVHTSHGVRTESGTEFGADPGPCVAQGTDRRTVRRTEFIS